ncbi:MAG TPA: DEAD/DEAH box helicase [Chitinophagaceae bacterium]|nr:DEAD/DEAH box helicase [Chitinophagaceae bacterium]MCC6634332.1 DEAD/DEAH box helicase [Chitinophagaceae bacterium]HMZ45693.1 DEAD/DEAH box helicase [Chitinophagaceae bacterium]HNE92848.1 DEAD/DEAH box helicase [Chitinophagaceae bacterium]HNF29169.1 DEAD/DEAH box helicase [Chitinophagaceae bacterium]
MITFSALGLDEKLVKATDALGFEHATPIQEKSIPVLLSGTKDMIGLAQTGTGKTAAFGLPLLQLVQVTEKYPQALIVCPTRELCLQIVNEIEQFKKFISGMHVVAVYGGASIGMQIRELKRGVQIVVATPGRLIDLIERKAINLEQIKYVVLDEADEMLNMGFQEDIEFILQNTPQRESTWLFSATMPGEIKKVTKKYMKNPFEVTVGKVNTANKSIDHQYFITQAQHRYETLKRLIDFNPGMYGIIFTRTKADAQEIAEKLTREGYDIDALHGDLSQPQRDKVMNAFRDKTLQLLIATDVAARGIDVKEITHVINYELPDDTEVYTHRSGRTGRAGSTGVCMSIVHAREIYKLRNIERFIQTKFNKLEIPSGKDVCRKQFYTFMDKLLQTDISHGEYATFLPMLQEKFAEVSKEEVLQRVAALEFDRFLKYYENAEDLNIREQKRDTKREFGGDGRDQARSRGRDNKGVKYSGGNGFARLFVNLGTKDGFYKASFLQFILDMSDLRKDVLGRIDMKEMNSWIEIDKKAAKQMIQSIDGKNYRGRKIRMNDANSR